MNVGSVGALKCGDISRTQIFQELLTKEYTLDTYFT